MKIEEMNIYQKLHHIRTQPGLDFIRKLRKENGAKYPHLTVGMVLAPIHPAINESRLFLDVDMVSCHRELMQMKTRDGEKTKFFVTVQLKMSWINIDKPEEKLIHSWESSSESWDGYDKALGSALSYGIKYYFLQQFQIPHDELDPDFMANKSERTFNSIDDIDLTDIIVSNINTLSSYNQLKDYHSKFPELHELQQFKDALNKRREQIKVEIEEKKNKKISAPEEQSSDYLSISEADKKLWEVEKATV